MNKLAFPYHRTRAVLKIHDSVIQGHDIEIDRVLPEKILSSYQLLFKQEGQERLYVEAKQVVEDVLAASPQKEYVFLDRLNFFTPAKRGATLAGRFKLRLVRKGLPFEGDAKELRRIYKVCIIKLMDFFHAKANNSSSVAPIRHLLVPDPKRSRGAD